jgi:hypothetical protein
MLSLEAGRTDYERWGNPWIEECPDDLMTAFHLFGFGPGASLTETDRKAADLLARATAGARVLDRFAGRMRPGGGVEFCSQPFYPGTAANLCLEMISDTWRRVYLAGGPGVYRNPANPMTCGEDPRKAMPANGKRFQKTGSLANPGVEGVDFTVLQFRVPDSWDGVIVTLTNQWDGAGFVDGSGDLVWRVRFDNQWFKDLDNILITLGRLENPYELEGAGYQLTAGQTITYTVQLGPGSLGRLDPNGRVTCALSGWFYPRG